MPAATSRATCGASEVDFAVVSQSPTELNQLLGGAGQSDEAPAADGAPDHGRAAVPGVDSEFLDFLEGDPWEGCDDVAEWGFVDWCADIARQQSTKVDEGATGLRPRRGQLALFLADGNTDGDSTRPNSAAEVSDRPSLESMSTCSLKSLEVLMTQEQEFASAFRDVYSIAVDL
jgi:hypothetical protein